ncbi:hypothetical protein ACKVMT_11095 [Halobacteriales archaeon Cl-PHB]
MEVVDIATGSITLLVALGVGTVLHELSHVVALRVFGVACEIRWLADADDRRVAQAGATWGTVVPVKLPTDLAPWHLRVSALMPLTLAAPLPLAFAGIVPDPLTVGDPALAAAVVGLLACAIPSPQDFSVVWYADRALEQVAE